MNQGAMTEKPMAIVGIPEFEGGPRPSSWMARGHHDPVAFAHALADDPEYQRWNGNASVCALHVFHRYWRAIPHGRFDPGRWSYRESDKSAGAFAVTVYYD